jgi:eukaryotic-like serine/threonine-protein kinase
VSPERWQKMEALYDAAAAMLPAERARFLEEQCAGDESLRRELSAMLEGEGSGLTHVLEGAAVAMVEMDDRWTGRRMGPYRVVRQLGAGGMGAVFLAVRDDDQYRKDVAVKTLKFDAGDAVMLSRFRHERQILAHLEHPNIARLLDGGTTAEGTPYIVLEYVAGVSITTYCQEQKLSLEQRLRLFRQVCDAVQYAHRNLIVHRDIKPGNILVTAEGAPKLLDFGIAKLLDPGSMEGAESMAATATGLHLMTPDYASPEQVRGEAISTASDVYSLGAVLYQLLTGERPHELKTYAAEEVARVVCLGEIRRPSAHGNRRLRGDLDTIVLKAMQKEAARRYSSVEQFSEDIRRYLEGLPVTARPDTTAYRTVKFVRRHRIGVASAAALFLALAGGIGLSMREARIAQRRFAQVRELANTFLFQFYDQVTPLPGSTAVRASIVETARKYLDGLSKEAGNDKGLLLELGQAYERLGQVQSRPGISNLGRLDDARRSFQSATDLYARVPVTRQSPETERHDAAWALFLWSRMEFNAGNYDKTETLDRRAMDLLGANPQAPPNRLLYAMGQRCLGEVRAKDGHTAEALRLTETAYQTMLGLRSVASPPRDLSYETANTEDRLVRLKVLTGDLDGALATYQQLVRDAGQCDEHGPLSGACRELAFRLRWVAGVYTSEQAPNLGDRDEGIPFYEHSMRLEERMAAADAQDRQMQFQLASTSGLLGDAIWTTDPKRALDLYGRVMAIGKGLAAKEQFDNLRENYLASVSRPLVRLRRTAEARKALTEYKQLAGSHPPSKLFVDQLSDIQDRALWPPLLWAEGNHEEAVELLRGIVRDSEKLHTDHPQEFSAVFFLCQYYRDLASRVGGEERRQALLKSAESWHSWPATSFTKREEEKDRREAERRVFR